MGVKPTVEVKRPDVPEPLDAPAIIEGQDPNAPNATPTPAATPKPKTQAVVEDIQLKKALELLAPKAAAATAGWAG